ncbi:MAG TPA: CRISPR-associated endonuclease Cas2 [Candidatus Paceibacterota bacterium]
MRPTRKTLAREVLRYLIIGGAVAIALSTPYGVHRLMREVKKEFKRRKLSQKNFQDTFSYLRRRGYLHMESRHGQDFLGLSKKGREIARTYVAFQVPSIPRPQRWNGKWHIVLFDISTKKQSARNSLRFMLKRLGFCQLQKSVWVIPFECRKEIESLKSFFGLSDMEVRLVVSTEAGNMRHYRKIFDLG